jgi:hypothetical protein
MSLDRSFVWLADWGKLSMGCRGSFIAGRDNDFLMRINVCSIDIVKFCRGRKPTKVSGLAFFGACTFQGHPNPEAVNLVRIAQQ